MTKHAVILEAVTVETPRIRSFLFRGAAGDLPGWRPGAHVEFTLPGGSARAYSLMPAAPGHWRIAVLREDPGTGGSRQMHDLKPGAQLTASAPKNDFELAPDGPALFVAGGIGITPFAAMLAASDGHLFYCGPSRDQMAFADALETEFPGRVTLHADDMAGGLPDLAALIAQHSGAHVYICGPRPMIDAGRAAADKAGIPESRVHVELFAAAAPVQGDQPFEVVVHSTGQTYTIPPGRSIIDVLEEDGHELMYDCRRGDCGICQTDVIEGTPDHRDVVLSQAEKDSGNVMQICVSRAKSPRLVLDL